MSEEWGPWIEWGCAKGVPESVGTYVQAHQVSPFPEFFEGFIKYSAVDAWSLVTRYRVRKPKGLTILNAILREVEREKETV